MLVEDDVAIRNELASFLSNNGYEVNALETFDSIIEDILSSNIDILLLDLSLPNNDGHFIAKEIRKVSDLPIIVVTSRDSKMDELLSINTGADDYITKPYNLQILLARMESILRRTNKTEASSILKIRDLELNLEKGILIKENHNTSLTKNELLILTYLINNKNKIVTREMLMSHLWGGDSFIDENTLTVNVNRLRLKLSEELDVSDLIETKRGMGYIINEN